MHLLITCWRRSQSNFRSREALEKIAHHMFLHVVRTAVLLNPIIFARQTIVKMLTSVAPQKP